MFIPKKFIEQEKEPKKPKNPIIANKEAYETQETLKEELNRTDICSNIKPSNEKDPLVILVHGYSSSKWLWIKPYFGSHGWLRDYHSEPNPRSYGWHSNPPPGHMYLPFTYTLSPLLHPEGTFTYLKRNKIDVLTYSQIDPFGDIDTSAKELGLIIKSIQKLIGDRRIILVGHSRGGLCIRRYLDLTHNTNVQKVITIGTPHKGTNFLNLKVIKQPLLKLLNESKVKRFWDVKGWREATDIKHEQMAVNSPFLQNLADYKKHPEIDYISIAGSVSTFAYLYSWSIEKNINQKTTKALFHLENKQKTKKGKPVAYHWVAKPKKILTVFEALLLPEFKHGDGLISIKSAIFDRSKKKYILSGNHEELPNMQETKKILMKQIRRTMKDK